MKNSPFTENLLKGRIGEFIFQEMFGESDKFTILPFGYEHAFPILAQHKKQKEIESVLKFIRRAPDFALVSSTEQKVYLVEVKYRKTYDKWKFKRIAQEINKEWDPSWLFIATRKGFYFSLCRDIINNNGDIEPLSEEWVKPKLQAQYLELLNKYLQNADS